MSDVYTQWISLGLGGVLISLVGFSIWKLIGAWMAIASTERDHGDEVRIRAEAMQSRLNKEIEMRVKLEVEVKFLEKEIAELKLRLSELEYELEHRE